MATRTKTTMIIMDADGRLTLPPELRDALDVEGETWLFAEVIDHRLVLRPAGEDLTNVPEDDRWLYTPEHIAEVRQAWDEDGSHLTNRDLLRFLPE